jgi:lipoyl(octanoyl) transferase
MIIMPASATLPANTATCTAARLRSLGLQDYEPVWKDMKSFTETRGKGTPDEFWLVEHPPVFTLGLNGKREHIHDAGNIPVIPVDRGGQVTYHGPGQVVIYLLLDIRQRGMGVRELVSRMEQAVIDLLQEYRIEAEARPDAPGVYVNDEKIAALGLRIKRGKTYHGISLNVDMDLSPFYQINPCGYPGLRVTQLKDLGIGIGLEQAQQALLSHLVANLGYTIDPDSDATATRPE